MTETLSGPKGQSEMLCDNKQILNLDWTIQLLKRQCLFSFLFFCSYMLSVLELKCLHCVIVLLHGQETGVLLRCTASCVLFVFFFPKPSTSYWRQTDAKRRACLIRRC